MQYKITTEFHLNTTNKTLIYLVIKLDQKLTTQQYPVHCMYTMV